MTATPPTSPSASARMKPRDLLVYGLKELGLPEDDSTTNAFMLYLSELKKWNRAYSLTSIKKDEDVVLKHFLDSLLFLPALAPLAQLGHSPRVADVGSGAGFPGIPIKIVRPDIHMTLIEPTQKKAAFLKHMVRTLNLKGVEVLEQRVEDLKGAGFDAALTRALYKIDEFIKKASPAVRPGGLLITSKGPSVKNELMNTTAEYEIIKTRLPHSNIERNIITIKI